MFQDLMMRTYKCRTNKVRTKWEGILNRSQGTMMPYLVSDRNGFWTPAMERL
ncbi:hypothetical protein M758_8G053500 [Ceratodon purpureus]|nr:hypothetical protein M758_8G053500 [Ceratodon purpureus]